jgi:hypothetical protein
MEKGMVMLKVCKPSSHHERNFETWRGQLCVWDVKRSDEWRALRSTDNRAQQPSWIGPSLFFFSALWCSKLAFCGAIRFRVRICPMSSWNTFAPSLRSLIQSASDVNRGQHLWSTQDLIMLIVETDKDHSSDFVCSERSQTGRRLVKIKQLGQRGRFDVGICA